MTGPDPDSRDVLASFENVRYRLFERLEGLTDAEYLWEPVRDSLGIRPGDDGVFRVDELFPQSVPGVPDPVTTIAWRIWHIGAACLRGYPIYFFDDVPDLGDRREWPGTAKEGVQALTEDWERFISRIAALGDERLLAPTGIGAGDWAYETYLKLALRALEEAAHHGNEIALLRDLHRRNGAEVFCCRPHTGGSLYPLDFFPREPSRAFRQHGALMQQPDTLTGASSAPLARRGT